MTKRDEIKAAIDKLPDDRLEQVHRLLAEFSGSGLPPKTKGFLQKLQEIQIEGPPDFSENWNLYVSGQKSIGGDVR